MFRKAERRRSKLRILLTGLTNSGKTYSALTIATGMGGKIAMIDTEAGRGDFHAEDFNYDILTLNAPYSPQRYIEAIKGAEQAGYDTLVIDSLSHAWVGEGGVLSVVDRAGGNKFTSGWSVATPMHNALVDAIVTSKMHIIATMRSKPAHALEQNAQGKMVPRKIGLEVVQRDGFDYEFTVIIDMSPEENIGYVSKDNTRNYDKQYMKPNQDMGKKFVAWLDNLKPEAIDEVRAELHGAKGMDALRSAFQKCMATHPQLKNEIKEISDDMKLKLLGTSLGKGGFNHDSAI